MNLYKMNINDEYLSLIKKGYKKHEYRLFNDKRKPIKVDDYLMLVSNTNSNDFIKVKVIKIETFQHWDKALSQCWKEDFKDLYSSLDELINVCNTFYSKEDIEKYGIVVYSISLIK